MAYYHKYDTVIRFVEDSIKNGSFKLYSKLPSLNAFQSMFNLSRCTVFQAMEVLRSRGIIESEPSVGYFVSNTDVRARKKVLFLFGEINPFKEELYNSIMKDLGQDIETRLNLHYRERDRFCSILKDANGKFTDFVLMPGQMEGLAPLLSTIKGKVYLLDHFNDDLKGLFQSVGQDFDVDTYDALVRLLPRLRKYHSLVLVQRSPIEPMARYDGIRRFGEEFDFPTMLFADTKTFGIQKGVVYIVPDDSELVAVIRQSRGSGLQIGKDFGIISFNDSDLKEVLEGGITTITTDFCEMGRTIARMINTDTSMDINTIHNPWMLKIRESI